MDPDELLGRFEREYLNVHSITAERRKQQFAILRRLDAQSPLYTLTAAEVQTFIGADLERGLSPNTARKHLGMIRSYVAWATAAGLIESSRAAQLKLVPDPRGSCVQLRPNPYKIAEVRAFKALLAAKYPALPTSGKGSRAMPQFLRGHVPRLRRHLWRHAKRLQYEAQIALALEAGLRRIEIYSLTIPAMHYDNDEVVVLTAKQGPGREVRRAIPYTAHARACVQEWLDFRLLLRPPHESPWLALDYVYGLERQIAPLSLTAFARLDRTFGHGWRWHRFRHTAATEWLRSGVPIEKVCRFLGHATLEQTRAYTEILDSDITEAFGRAEADFARRLGLAA